MARSTIMKYREGDPEILCRFDNKGGVLHQYRDYILMNLQNGMTQSEIICQLRKKYGYSKSRTLAYRYMEDLIQQYQLTVTRYRSSEMTSNFYDNTGSSNKKYSYITRKGIWGHLWMNRKLLKEHHTYIWKEYPVLWILESCIQEFRAIFEHKNISYLYLFIEKFKVSSIKELATFAIGLEKDIDAIENAVASDLSNGFVEGMNNKLKMIKRTMYGRSSKKLLEAKLMYRVSD